MLSGVRPCQVVCHSKEIGDWTDGVGFLVTADFACTIDNWQFLDVVFQVQEWHIQHSILEKGFYEDK